MNFSKIKIAARAVFAVTRLLAVLCWSRFRNRHYTACRLMADSSLQSKSIAIYVDNTTNLSANIGYLVTYANATPAVNNGGNATTVPAQGIVLDARVRTVSTGATYYDNSIGLIGLLPGPVRAMLNANSAACNFGDPLMQAADGTLTKEVTGANRVFVGYCADLNGAQAGQLFDVALVTPVNRTY